MVLEAKPIPYQLDKEFKTTRDRALLAILAMLGQRISEILSIKRNQFNFDDPEFIVIEQIRVLKRRKEPIYVDRPLPRDHVLTELILKHYNQTRGKDRQLFDLSRYRAWQIVRYMTGKWCHFFRSQHISHLINEERLREGEVAKDLGIKKVETIMHYHKSSWKDHKEAYK